ncbi:MAG: DUF349 domain-containing protein [Bacteroidales bacterium]|nr:DUF349 domain-containing protein [Bacteroidales bacterium]
MSEEINPGANTPDVVENVETNVPVGNEESTIMDKVADVAAALGAKVKEKASDAIDSAKDALADKVDDLKEAYADAKEAVSDLVDDAKEAVADKMDDVKDAIADAKEAIADKVDDIKEALSDKDDAPVEKLAEEPKSEMNFAEKTLAELTALFEALLADVDKMKRSKEAEAIKSAFYRRLSKEKAEAGIENPEVNEDAPETEPVAEEDSTNPFTAIENGFKSLYNTFKKEKAEFNRKIDAERADNLAKKEAIIEELKALADKQDDVSAAFPEFRALQARWRETGPVPMANFRNINDTYQLYVERFYDRVQMNREMRDLDFKKNLEAKEKFCEEAEELAQSDDAVTSFRELQKLHEQWKEFGPVAKEFRESIWERFKAATAVINRKYQAYFEEQKGKQAENLERKATLCEKVEAIAATESIKSTSEWNNLSKQIEEIQQEWKTIGFASKKENQKIYDRFRAACDKFFERKRQYYSEFKENMTANLEKKMAIIEQAEALKDSTEWKKTTDQIIGLQKQWKEIGSVPRKKSDQLWKRFRAACDEFFANRDKNAKPENDYYGNLKAKRALIEEIKAFSSDDPQLMQDAYDTFSAKWNSIGFVPFKEKENIAKAYKEAMQDKFPGFGFRGGSSDRRGGQRQRAQKAPLTEKDRLVQKYTALQQDIDTYENNIGFFAASKNAQALISQMQEKIAQSKAELKELEDRIRQIEDEQEAAEE